MTDTSSGPAWSWWVRDECIGLSPSARLLLYALASRVGADGRAFPSLLTMAADTGLHRSTIVRAVAELEGAGAVRVERVTGSRSRYTLTREPVAPRDRSHSGTGRTTRRGGSHSATGGVAQCDPKRTMKRTRKNPVPRAHAREGAEVVPLQPLIAQDPPDGLRLLGELSKVLTKRRPWTYNEETNAAQLLSQYGLDACLEVVKTMDAADSPVAMLRRRLEKRGNGRPGGKSPSDMTDAEFQQWMRETRQ